MQLADLVPKMTTEGTTDEGGGLFFCTVEEGIGAALRAVPLGKVLLLSDEASVNVVPFAENSRVISVVLSTADCLPLFAMPEVSLVIGIGNRDLMIATRYFATVRRVPCVVIPSNATMDGIYERRTSVTVGDEQGETAVTSACVVCDLTYMRPSFSEAYARLLLSRLALIETHALRLFTGAGEPQEEAYELATRRVINEQTIVLLNARLRLCEREGTPVGEGVVLSKHFGVGGEWRAYRLLSSLYAACFLRKPRATVVPDYSLRARQADVPYATVHVPTLAEYKSRTLLWERVRTEILTELMPLLRDRRNEQDRYCGFGGTVSGEEGLATLKKLPEYAPKGLSSYFRDFGWMEF